MARSSPWLAASALPLVLAAGLLAGCSEAESPDDKVDPVRADAIARVVPAEQALAGLHLPTLDLHTMPDAEIRKVVGAGPRCEFRYTTAGRGVLGISTEANGAAAGVVKLGGDLVSLAPQEGGKIAPETGDLTMRADPISITLSPDAAAPSAPREGVVRREASMVFEVGNELRVGYRGYLDCASDPSRIRHRR